MATYYSPTAAAGKNARAVGWAGTLKTAVGIYEIATVMALGDHVVMAKLPKGAVITGGRLFGDQIDSTGSGSALASINIGVNASLKSLYDRTSFGYASNSNALLSAWSLGADAAAVTGVHAAGFRNMPLGGLLQTVGPVVTTEECQVEVIFNASILALTTGTLMVEVQYYMESDS